jgi:hypothetical protein
MSKNIEKPSAEAKALSLFFMAYKAKDNVYKEKSKRINRLWDLVKANELSKEEYLEEVNSMLESYGGYTEVIEKTVKFYIDTTGEWKSRGDDKYAVDATKIANEILNN